jgi:hypothetical protein
MYCDACAPAVIVTGIRRGAPLPRSSSACGPGLSETVTGVTPRSTPSMNSCAPGGLVETLSVPSAGAAAGAKNRRAAGTPAPASANNASAAAAIGSLRREAAGFSAI